MTKYKKLYIPMDLWALITERSHAYTGRTPESFARDALFSIAYYDLDPYTIAGNKVPPKSELRKSERKKISNNSSTNKIELVREMCVYNGSEWNWIKDEEIFSERIAGWRLAAARLTDQEHVETLITAIFNPDGKTLDAIEEDTCRSVAEELYRMETRYKEALADNDPTLNFKAMPKGVDK